MSHDKRVKELEATMATLGADVDEAMLRHLKEIPTWLMEFYVNVSECLERPKAWRNPAPSQEHRDQAKELLILLGAPHLADLFDSQNVDGWDKWEMQMVVMILEKMTVIHLARGLGLSEEKAAEDLRLMLKLKGYGCVLGDPQASARLSPQAQSYLRRLRPSEPRSPRP
jgi:hypothetical protein